jgi:hypothetical protein
MCISSRLLALLVLTFCALPARAVDLTKIDRAIAKEPAYQGKPKYCLAVFGLEAKTRIWLVLDGDTLYVDRNGSGDLTEPDKQVAKKAGFFVIGTIREADGTAHTNFRVEVRPQGMSLFVMVRGEHYYSVQRMHDGEFDFADRKENAPIVHFNGPLALGISRSSTVRERNDSNQLLLVSLGTAGLGRGAFASTSAKHFKIAAGVEGLIDIEFPSKVAGEKAIRVTSPLKPDE